MEATSRTENCCSLSPTKIFGVSLHRFSSKRSRSTPVYTLVDPEDAIDSNNNCIDCPEETEKMVFATPVIASLYPRPSETKMSVTPKKLKKILKSTTRRKKIWAVNDLVVKGTESRAAELFDAKLIRKLKSACPSIKSLSLQNLNLSTGGEEENLCLRHFPADLESLSLRDSILEPRSFFDGMNGHAMKNLRVLDLSRTLFIKGRYLTLMSTWPKIDSLRELYLEGAMRGRAASNLKDLLTSFPNLEVLDLECNDLEQRDLGTISGLLPNLRELYLGQTGLKNAAVFQMVTNERRLNDLEVICLCGTDITDTGLQHLMEVCPNLRSVIGRGSSISFRKAAALERSVPGLQIDLVEMMCVFLVFDDRCCDHHSSRQDRSANDAIGVRMC